MFVVVLTYKKPLPEVDQHLAAHRAFLDTCYQNDHLIVSGPQNPRTGGVLVSQLKTRPAVELLIQQDPFYKEGIADYQIIQFDPVKCHKHFQGFLS
jgi:uncharacterized protein YciI